MVLRLGVVCCADCRNRVASNTTTQVLGLPSSALQFILFFDVVAHCDPGGAGGDFYGVMVRMT